MRVQACDSITVHVWKLDDNLRWQSSPSTLFEKGSLVHHWAYQASCFPFHCRNDYRDVHCYAWLCVGLGSELGSSHLWGMRFTPWDVSLVFLYLFCFVLESRSHYITLASMVFLMSPRMASNSQEFSFSASGVLGSQLSLQHLAPTFSSVLYAFKSSIVPHSLRVLIFKLKFLPLIFNFICMCYRCIHYFHVAWNVDVNVIPSHVLVTVVQPSALFSILRQSLNYVALAGLKLPV